MPSAQSTELNAPKATRILLLSYPRTTSHLLLQILKLENQKNFTSNEFGGYYFEPAFERLRQTGKPRKGDESSKDSTQEIHEIYQACLETLEDDSRSAEEQGKALFAKEHTLWLYSPITLNEELEEQDAHSRICSRVQSSSLDMKYLSGSTWSWSANNQTVLPDEYLRSWRLAFLIRNPVRAFPSYYRNLLELEKENYLHQSELYPLFLENMTLRWTRLLYDWSLDQGVEPPVLDSDDIINNQSIIVTFCNIVGLDTSELTFSWAVRPHRPCVDKGKEKSIDQIMVRTLAGSTGPRKDKSCEGVNIATEFEEWRREFGQEMAERLEKYVRAALPDYEYLRARRLAV